MEPWMWTIVGIVIYQFLKWGWKKLRTPPRKGGFRVTFSATTSTFDESTYLLDHILKVRHPQSGSFTMYDVDYKVEK